MEFWQRAHWFATSLCNEICKFCFRPEFQFEDSPEVTQTLATKLVNNDIKEVIFTGGEPLLLKSLDSGLKTLSNANIYTGIHTNATLLTPKRLESLATLVDEIAIPIDSLDKQTQEYLRGTDCLLKVKKIFRQLQDLNIKIGIHTVATKANIKIKEFNLLVLKIMIETPIFS